MEIKNLDKKAWFQSYMLASIILATNTTNSLLAYNYFKNFPKIEEYMSYMFFGIIAINVFGFIKIIKTLRKVKNSSEQNLEKQMNMFVIDAIKYTLGATIFAYFLLLFLAF